MKKWKWNTIVTFALAALSAANGFLAFCHRGERHAKAIVTGVLFLAGAALWLVNGILLVTNREPLAALEIEMGGEDDE